MFKLIQLSLSLSLLFSLNFPSHHSAHFLAPNTAVKIIEEVQPDYIIALGGNAFGKGDTTKSGREYWESLRPQIKTAAEEIAALVLSGNKVIISHGNGPQVGKLLNDDPNTHLADHVETTQNEMGRILKEELEKALGNKKTPVKFFNTETIVESNDPAFQEPTKPVGWFSEKVAKKLEHKMKTFNLNIFAKEFDPDKQEGWRLVVPSPQPIGLSHLAEVKAHMTQGGIAIMVGGGGIPIDTAGNRLIAVIDKDRATGLASTLLKPKTFVILTAVKQVASSFGTPDAIHYDELNPDESGRLRRNGELGKGSMLPKVEAAEMVREQGVAAVITALGNIKNALARLNGEATWFMPRAQSSNGNRPLRTSPYHTPIQSSL